MNSAVAFLFVLFLSVHSVHSIPFVSLRAPCLLPYCSFLDRTSLAVPLLPCATHDGSLQPWVPRSGGLEQQRRHEPAPAGPAGSAESEPPSSTPSPAVSADIPPANAASLPVLPVRPDVASAVVGGRIPVRPGCQWTTIRRQRRLCRTAQAANEQQRQQRWRHRHRQHGERLVSTGERRLRSAQAGTGAATQTAGRKQIRTGAAAAATATATIQTVCHHVTGQLHQQAGADYLPATTGLRGGKEEEKQNLHLLHELQAQKGQV